MVPLPSARSVIVNWTGSPLRTTCLFATLPKTSVGLAARANVFVITAGVAPGLFATGTTAFEIARVGETSEDASRQPFADGKTFPACGGPRRFARFGRDARNVPRKIRPHIESLRTAPAREGIGGNILCKERLTAYWIRPGLSPPNHAKHTWRSSVNGWLAGSGLPRAQVRAVAVR